MKLVTTPNPSLKRRGVLVGLIALLAFSVTPASALTLAESELEAGDLIRGETYSSVYYFGDDGLRYVFPTEDVYMSWYVTECPASEDEACDPFSDVIWLSDAALATIQIGGNVTYKPGLKMLKINSDPTVYAVAGGSVIRPIDSEEVAEALYGAQWNTNIVDVADGLFSNYTIGSGIEIASQYDSDAEAADAYSISSDRGLSAYTLVEITDQGYIPSTVTVKEGTAIRFLNTSNESRSVTEWNRIWGSGTMGPGDHYTRYFDESGRWHYYSTYGDRNVFEGAIIVE